MTSSANSESVTYAKAFGVKTAAETGDIVSLIIRTTTRIRHLL